MKREHRNEALSTGAERLTAEAHVVQAERLELSKDGHIRCDSPTQLVLAENELFEIRKWRK